MNILFQAHKGYKQFEIELLLLHCHSTVAPAVNCIVHSRRLKMHNQGNSFHQWLSGACVFLIIAVFEIVENIQGGNLITLYSSIEQS